MLDIHLQITETDTMSTFDGYDLAAFDFSYEAVAAAHRQALLDKIPAALRVRTDEWSGRTFQERLASSADAQRILASVRAEQCERAAVDLVHDLQTGVLSVEEVTRAFLAMAALAHQATACLSDYFYEEALARARELDKVPLAERKANILFGLPMTIKGHFHLKGTGNQRGFVSDVLSPRSALHPSLSPERKPLLRFQGPFLAQDNSLLVEILLGQGAVLLGKTTMPQSVMHLDTRSNLFGQTLNPTNLALSPGGSSGGESAVLGCNASAGGIGTDIGGSVRHPCGVTGLYGLRPTCARLPPGGTRSNMPGNESIGATCGPMARDARDVSLLMRAILGAEPWRREPWCVRMPWRELRRGADVTVAVAAEDKRVIKIGVIRCDGVVRPVAPVLRALEDVLTRLSSAGYGSGGVSFELTEIDVGDRHAKAWDLIRSLFTDAGAVIKALADASGEPLLPLTSHILSHPSPAEPLSANEIWTRQAERDAFRAAYTRFFESLGVDYVLTPVAPGPAPRPEKAMYWGYTSVWNLVDYPSVTFPTGHVADAARDAAFGAQVGGSKEEEEEDEEKTLGEWDAWQAEEYKTHKNLFDGAPICLQLVARRFHEEELMDALGEIEKALGESVALKA
ncbi:hypothetical protein OC842_004937 [Tilletia horrida]|uniref:amidase n=1 Tax=Tilletia horrida TaxID=155126 RepID=A0AAN6G8Q6_9BASI|nr:hypothetical protein OC842_004937 [Tilletia horrida]